LSNRDRYLARRPCYSTTVLLIIPPQFSISKGFTQRSHETRPKNAIWRRTNKISSRTNQIPNCFAILTSDRFPQLRPLTAILTLLQICKNKTRGKTPSPNCSENRNQTTTSKPSKPQKILTICSTPAQSASIQSS